MNLKNILTFLLFGIIVFMLNSCATIISGTKQKVELYSIPDSAQVFHNGEDMQVVTPCTIKVNRRQKPTLYNSKNEHVFEFKKLGYQDMEVSIESRMNTMIFSNTAISVPVGLIDPFELMRDGTGWAWYMRVLFEGIPFSAIAALIDVGTGSAIAYDKRVFAHLEPGLSTILFENAQPSINAEQSLMDNTVGGGLALCIGNGNYEYASSLSNPVNDANDMARVLKNTGYTVMVYNDLAQDEMRRAIDDFGNELKNYEIGLFFYAGHGIQAKGDNYLIPVDANISGESEVEYTCVNAGRVLGKMESSGSTTNIVLLDACRNNPFERSWTRNTQGRGLAVMDAPIGSLIGFATSPGNTASDGEGSNGVYTSAILKYIYEPDLTILEMMQLVRKYVRESTGGQQIPWESTSLEGNYYFNKK